MEAATGDRLRSPFEALAAFEHRTDLWMCLQLLQEIVRRKADVSVIEADDHSYGQHVGAHGVDEGATEFAVLRLRAERPAEGVDHVLQGFGNLPDFFHAELPYLWVLAPECELIQRHAGE